jgi:DNA-binding transcriptional MocR family regulator
MTIWVPVLDRSKPLYLAIADAISHDVEGGTLSQGTRLPPQRDLAWKLGVTLGTVTRAYKEAEKRGLLEGEVGRGSYIRMSHLPAPLPPTPIEQDGITDLSQAIPPPVVTKEELDAAMSAVMRDPRRLDLLDYAPPEGYPQHRAMARQWLLRSGLDVPEQDVFITAGAHMGLMLVLEAIMQPFEQVMVENLNYALLRTTLANAHLEPLPLEMDEDGLLPDSFEAAARLGKARVLYIVPSLQNPTTHTMSRQRREAIVAIARRFDITILEDDIFHLLDDRVQPPTFHALAPERTYHFTSLSKTLGPGLRIGIVVAPRGQERVMRTHLRSSPLRSVGLTGEIARYWIESELASAILTRTRNELASRRAAFMEVFKTRTFRCEPGAPFAWLKLPDQWSPAAFTSTLLQRRVRITAGTAFQIGQRQPSQHVRVCFGHPQTGWRSRAAFGTIAQLMDEEPEDDFTPVA